MKYEKVSIIVSGALDRLHYLEDPCIKYETEKKVWHYLHRDRDENHPGNNIINCGRIFMNYKEILLKLIDLFLNGFLEIC